MIKKVILGMFLLGFIPNTHTEIKAQSYTTQSKSCGSCGKQVSIHSKIIVNLLKICQKKFIILKK